MLKKLAYMVIFALIGACYAKGQNNPSPIIPKPNAEEFSGKVYTITPETAIAYTGKNMETNALYLQAGIGEICGYTLKCLQPRGKNQIVLRENRQLQPSQYKIDTSGDNIVCEASTDEGIFYAIQTLLQSIGENDGRYTVPSMKIDDAPRYEWRGMMLDVSRHFFGKDVIKQLLDVMAHLKMNRFHLHLTDENGWRVEIKKYPELTAIGAEGNWHDRSALPRFFTQEDIKEIVEYARQRHIMVIPEIDMPGHASAASRAYPEISAGGTGRWEGFTFHPAKEETFQFLDDVLTEIAELFPAPYIHIGGDEVHYGNQVWFTDPLIQGFIKEKGLKDEIGLEHYFIRRACEIVAAKGKKVIGWDEIISSGVSPDNVVVMWWRHDKPEQLDAALRNGFEVILTPRLPCYFDFVQDDSQRVGRRWGGKYNTLENVYAFPDGLSEIINKFPGRIMGAQACAWTERIADNSRLYYMLFPRLAAIAEATWTQSDTPKEYRDFETRIKFFLKYLDKKKINYYNPFDADSTPEPWGPDKADVIAEG